MPKRKGYTKPQTKALLRTPFGGDNSTLYNRIASKSGKTRDAVYQQHKRLHEKGLINAGGKAATVKVNKLKTAKVTAIPAQKGASFTLYSLYSDVEVSGTHETDKFKERMRPLINAMDVYDPKGTRHVVPFETSKAGLLRIWLKSSPDFKGKEFTVKSVAGNKSTSLLIRKS